MPAVLEVHAGLALHDDHGIGWYAVGGSWCLLARMMAKLLSAAATRLSGTWRSLVSVVGWSAARSITAGPAACVPLLLA